MTDPSRCFHRLSYLAAALRYGSMRAAGDALDIAPSVVSRQIALLEKELGFQLLEKKGRNGVTGTEAAQVLLECHEQRNASIDHAMIRLDTLRNSKSSTLRIVATEGFLPSIRRHLFDVLGRQPNASLIIDFMSVPQLTQELLDDRAHLALVFAPIPHADLEILEHVHQPLHLIVPKDHALAACKTSVSFRAITAERLALTSPTIGIRQLVRRVETYEKVSLVPELTTSSLELIKHFVLSGRGVTLAPTIAFEEELSSGEAVALTVENATFLTAQACILAKRDRPPSKAVQDCVAMLRSRLSVFAGRGANSLDTNTQDTKQPTDTVLDH